MTSISVLPPYPVFFDKAGKPLEGGYVFIGEEGRNAQVYPIPIYWDEARTISAENPFRTIGGYPSRNGSPAAVYTEERYSISTRTSGDLPVYSSTKPTISLSTGSFLTAINVRDLLSGAHFSYGEVTGKQAVTAGQLIITDHERFVYEVAAAAAMDHNLVTDDGVKLYIIPAWPDACAEQFGLATTGTAAQNDAAFIAAFAWLNAESYRNLEIGAGVFNISRPLPDMVRSNTGVMGGGREVTCLRMDAATVSGRFFYIGNGTEQSVARVNVSGLRLELTNETTANGYMFDIDGTADVIVEDIHVSNAAGVIRLGNNVKSSRVRFNKIRGDYNDALNHRVGLFKRWTGLYMEDVVLYGGGTFERTVPTFDFSTVGLCDTLNWSKVTAWTRAGSKYGIFINADNGTFVNAWFEEIVLDKTGNGGAAVWIEQTAACTATADDFWKIQNVYFTTLRSDTGGDTPGGMSVKIRQGASTGFAMMRGIHFISPLWTVRDQAAFETVRTGTDVFDDVNVLGATIREAIPSGDPDIDAVFKMASNRFKIIGSSSGFAERNEVPGVTTFVEVTNPAIDEFVIDGNMVYNVTTNLVVEPAYTVPALPGRCIGIGNTFGAGGRVLAQTIVTNRGEDLVIAAGVITATHSFHAVDTQGAAATDDLTSIAAGYDGQMLTLRSVSSARVPTCKDGAGVANTLALAGDFALTDPRDRITLQYDAVALQWCEISRSNNS